MNIIIIRIDLRVNLHNYLKKDIRIKKREYNIDNYINIALIQNERNRGELHGLHKISGGRKKSKNYG